MTSAVLAAVVLTAAAVADGRPRDRMPRAPLAYQYFDERDRQPDGSYSTVRFGVYVNVVSSRPGGEFTGTEHRFAEVGLSDRSTRVWGPGQLLTRRAVGDGTCFLALFAVRPGDPVLGTKKAGDRVRVTTAFPRRKRLRRSAVIRGGEVSEETRAGRRLIRRAGCRPS